MKNSAPAERRHAHMVSDIRRTAPLLRAVRKAVRPGDTVVDIGTGLGVLAITAVKAGAKRVFAIDCDEEALAEAKRRAKKEKVFDQITFVHGLSFNFTLPARADVILCETVGSFAFDENILATIADARRRLLKKGGGIVPSRLELWGAPIEKIPRLSMPAEIGVVKKEDLLAKPALLARADFSKKFSDEIRVRRRFKLSKSGVLRAFAVWPRVTWGRGEITDASPLVPPTHWKQGILTVEEKEVMAGNNVSFEFIIKPHPDDPLRMTDRLWRCVA